MPQPSSVVCNPGIWRFSTIHRRRFSFTPTGTCAKPPPCEKIFFVPSYYPHPPSPPQKSQGHSLLCPTHMLGYLCVIRPATWARRPPFGTESAGLLPSVAFPRRMPADAVEESLLAVIARRTLD